MAKKKKTSDKKTTGTSPGGEKLIATNPDAKRNFHIDEKVEAGIVLHGTEIKSLRTQSPSLKDSFVQINARDERMEAWLYHVHIPPYSHGNIWNHEPDRKRKLLLHMRQIKKLFGATRQEGKTVVPMRIYLKKGLAKVELAVARGKKKGDRRESEKSKEAKRQIRSAMQKHK